MTDDDRRLLNRQAVLQAEIAEAKRKIADLTRERTPAEMDEMAAAQARADSACQRFGRSALPPVPGERPLDYRKRLVRDLQPYSARFKDADVMRLDAATFAPVEAAILADAKDAAYNPANHPPGRLVGIPESDGLGRTVMKFVGDPLAWMAPYMGQGVSGTINRSPPRER